MIALSEFCLKQVREPEVGKVYFCLDKGSQMMVPVAVINGQYEANGRISNFWEWRNIHAGERNSGYVSFWEFVEYEDEEA